MTLANGNGEISLLKADRKQTVEFAKRRAKQRNEKLQKRSSTVEELKQICKSLAVIAQRYVPANPAAFSDFIEVVQCIKLLKTMGINPTVVEKNQAIVAATGNEIIIKSADYRYLRNKCIAGFATIADLTEKPAAVGSQAFQSGVREGYRRASDIATMFLEDIQGGETKC